MSVLKEDISSTACDNVDFVHMCYIQCDLFDCCIFSYEIMPTTLANIFLFILQSVALAFVSPTVKELLKSDNICQSYAQMKKGPFLTRSVLVFVLDASLAFVTRKLLTKLSYFLIFTHGRYSRV